MLLLYPIFLRFLLWKNAMFTNCFLWIYCDNDTIFCLQIITMIYHSYWSPYVESFLSNRDKSHLVHANDLLVCWWIQLASIFLKIFIFMFFRSTSLYLSFFSLSFSDYGIKILCSYKVWEDSLFFKLLNSSRGIEISSLKFWNISAVKLTSPVLCWKGHYYWFSLFWGYRSS